MGKMLRIQVKIMRKLSSGISMEFSWQLLYDMKKYENDVLKCHLWREEFYDYDRRVFAERI